MNKGMWKSMEQEFYYAKKPSKAKKKIIIAIVGILMVIAACFIINYLKINNAKNQYIQSIKAVLSLNRITDENVIMNKESLDEALDETDKIYYITINSDEFSKLSADNQLKVELGIQNIDSKNLDLSPYVHIESAGKNYDVFDIASKYYSGQSESNTESSSSYADNNIAGSNSEATTNEEEPVADDEKGACWALAEDVVKSKLKSPSTAKFPFSYSSDGVSMTKSGDLYTVIGWVDAENSFGAELRSNFAVTMTKSGYGDNAKFTAESCEID